MSTVKGSAEILAEWMANNLYMTTMSGEPAWEDSDEDQRQAWVDMATEALEHLRKEQAAQLRGALLEALESATEELKKETEQ